MREARQRCLEQRIPSYDTPDDAVHAFIQRWRYQRNRIALMETPPSLPADFNVDAAAARALDDTLLFDRALESVLGDLRRLNRGK